MLNSKAFYFTDCSQANSSISDKKIRNRLSDIQKDEAKLFKEGVVFLCLENI